MPASGRDNRQALSQSRPLLAPTQVALKKSTIAPLTYRRRRSSETASDMPNTAAAATTPRPSAINFVFQFFPTKADVDSISLSAVMRGDRVLDSDKKKNGVVSKRPSLRS